MYNEPKDSYDSPPRTSPPKEKRRYPLVDFIHELISTTNERILDGDLNGTNLTLEELQKVVGNALDHFALMLCLDCEENTSHEYYMVSDEIWIQATREEERRSVLCIGCLEDRLGRSLNSEDFPKNIGLNQANLALAEEGDYRVSDRLKNRILY